MQKQKNDQITTMVCELEDIVAALYKIDDSLKKLTYEIKMIKNYGLPK